MNSTDWLNVLTALPTLITNVETTAQTSPVPLSGQQKLSIVLGAVAPLVPAERASVIVPYVNMLVSWYNLVGLFKHTAPLAPPAAQPAAPQHAIVPADGG